LKENGNDISLLVQGCIALDRKAQEKLYKDYYASMMGVCMRFTNNEQDALSLLNTGFYKVFVNINKYDSKIAGLYTWIKKIIVNTCLDFVKANKVHFGVLVSNDDIEVDIPPDVINNFNASDILKLIQKLPAATATVFNLYVNEGYKHKEIAELLSISIGTSKWHLNEARNKLQLLLKKIEV
jgi:RNA polymerase sigma factor (sigma-70 family)